MPKRSSRVRRQVKTEKQNNKPPAEKNPAAVALGRLGGLKGGKARAAKLSDEERSEIAKKAANARWGKTNRNTTP